MIDKEKIVNAFVLCRVNESCSRKCPYWDEDDPVNGCMQRLAEDVYSLLKEQEERIKKFELERSWDEHPDMMGKW